MNGLVKEIEPSFRCYNWKKRPRCRIQAVGWARTSNILVGRDQDGRQGLRPVATNRQQLNRRGSANVQLGYGIFHDTLGGSIITLRRCLSMLSWCLPMLRSSVPMLRSSVPANVEVIRCLPMLRSSVPMLRRCRPRLARFGPSVRRREMVWEGLRGIHEGDVQHRAVARELSGRCAALR
jgi:hypothetical protein